MIESPLMDSSFAVLVFSPGDDPISCLNKAMAFLTVVASLRFPSTNNQLRTSSNLRNQATIQYGRVTVQQVQGRQGQSYSGTGYKSNATSSGETMQADRKGLLNATTINVKGIWLDNALSQSDQGMQHECLSIGTLDAATICADSESISSSKEILCIQTGSSYSKLLNKL
ncbi:hypothetical protein Tco_1554059 [Tanacetum coccineum]